MITDINILKQDLPYIHNVKNFLVTPEKMHPDNPKYEKQWGEYFKYSVEGRWVYDVHGYRFMPSTLFFYGNFFKIESQINKQRVYEKPSIRDIDWLIHYEYLVACGFSGFMNDDRYSSDIALKDEDLFIELKNSWRPEQRNRFTSLLRSDGRIKEYVNPFEYLKILHIEPLGLPLYNNPACNMLIFGARGSGKSYSAAGIIGKELTFDGMVYYTKELLDLKPKVNITVGSSSTSKSSELLNKVVTNMGFLGSDPDFGCYGSPQDKDFIPGPFYRDWVGSIHPGNAKNPYRYEFDVDTDAGWQKDGTGTKLLHVNYSEKKAAGAADAAGSRNKLNVYEEIGLMPNFKDALLSNDATVKHNGDQFGVQLGLGTSGDIDLVQQTKAVFNDPETYRVFPHKNIWEPSESNIGLFLPAYLSDMRFKDANGNTDIEKALYFFSKEREKAAKVDDPSVLRFQKMNYPLIPSDMWVSNRGSYFPISELLEREKELTYDQSYKDKNLATPVELVWDSNAPRGVRQQPLDGAEPYYQFPFDRSMSKPDGCIVIYETPHTVLSEIPHDMYIYVLDPYVSENIEEGGSIGCLQVWMNPKYQTQGYNAGQLCATYYGKHPDGKDAFYQNCEKLIQYYGNCPRMLWYEANRGDSVRGYFMRKNKTNLLCIRPSKEKGSNAYERKVTEYGFLVGNSIDKLELITDAAEYLLRHVQKDGKQKRVLETLPDLFLVQQLIQYDIKGNFDAVSAFLGFPLAIKEIEHIYQREAEKKSKTNKLQFLSLNPNIFKNDPKYRQ